MSSPKRVSIGQRVCVESVCVVYVLSVCDVRFVLCVLWCIVVCVCVVMCCVGAGVGVQCVVCGVRGVCVCVLWCIVVY